MNIFQRTIAAAGTIIGDVIKFSAAPRNLAVQASFAYGAGGTSVDAYLQTSLDGGLTWVDVAQFSFTTSAARRIYNLSATTPKTTAVTPSDGAMTANTSLDGVLGSQFRVKATSVGAYTGATSLAVDIVTDQQA